MDLSLYDLTGAYEKLDSSVSEKTICVPSDAPVSKGIEVIAGKVVKFLLTNKGSDAFDVNYGGTALHRTHISDVLIPQITLELHDDIRNCIQYLKEGEESLPYTSERLANITVIGVDYNSKVSPDRLNVHILIETTDNNKAAIKLVT